MQIINYLSEQEYYDLMFSYVVSNTSSSLYNWLKENEAVIRISEMLSEDKLIDFYCEALRFRPRTEKSISLCYAIITAILLRRRTQNNIGSPPVSTTSLDWLADIWEEEVSSFIPTAQTNLIISHEHMNSVEIQDDVSTEGQKTSSTGLIILNPKD